MKDQLLRAEGIGDVLSPQEARPKRQHYVALDP